MWTNQVGSSPEISKSPYDKIKGKHLAIQMPKVKASKVRAGAFGIRSKTHKAAAASDGLVLRLERFSAIL